MIFGRFERAVAARYLRARRGERFVSIIAVFSLIGIALGVATLIIVMSVMGGFKADLLGRILGFNGDLGVYGAGQPLVNYQTLEQKILQVPGVISATPVVDGQVLATPARLEQGTAAYVRGIEPADLKRFRAVAPNIKAGSLDDFGGPDTIVIGIGMAETFGLRPGDRITLLSPQGAATAFGTIPRVRSYRIAAIFQAGMNEYDQRYVFLPLSAAQIFFQKQGVATQIEVMVKDEENVHPVARDIRNALDGIPVRVEDWEQNNDSFFAAVQVEKNVMFIILTLIILVAAFNVISSLIMMVKDKIADIAILRTLGASRGAIMRIFLMCGAFVGVAGTITGTLLGVVFCSNIERLRHVVEAVAGVNVFNPEVYYLTHLPSRLDPGEVIQIVVIALILSLLATLYPSWRAAKTDPVEALRHE